MMIKGAATESMVDCSEQLLKALASNFPNSYIAVLDKSLALQMISFGQNSAYRTQLNSTLGCSLSEMYQTYNEVDLELILSEYRKCLDGLPIRFEVRGRELHSVTPIADSQGNIERILCYVEYVGEQKQSLITLRKSEAHLKVATQLAKIGYWELDIDSGMFTFNDQFIDMLKVTPSYFGGHRIPAQRYADEFLFDEDRSMIESETRMAIESDDPNFSRYIEHRFINGEGEVGYLGVRYTVVKDNWGRTIKTVGANQDITERKLAEQRLKKLLEKTTEQNQRLKDFSFMTSHNIRSSVANLVGLCDLINEEPQNLDYIEMMTTTVKELDKTVKNINTLLNFDVPLSGGASEPCNVQDVIDRFIHLNQSWISVEGVEIASKIPKDLSVNCVPAYLDSVIHNLVTNAIKYGITDQSRLIEIGQVQTNGTAIYVRDFGQGLDLDEVGHKLFKPGSRFHPDSDGQGMGLYMTRHQIESAGGRLTVESQLGAGATFSVFFGCE